MAAQYHPAPEADACFQCMWHTLKDFSKDIKNNRPRPPVICNTSNQNSNRQSCDRCINTTHDPCEKIAEGMRGDSYDLFDLLTWADSVRDHTVTIAGQPPRAFWTAEEKTAILKVSEVLFKAFKTAEKAHRIEHGIKVGKMARAANGADVRYHYFVKARLDVLEQTQLAPHNPASGWLARLVPGDQGYAAWLLAKETFAEKMSGLMDKKNDQAKKEEFKAALNRGIVDLHYRGIGGEGRQEEGGTEAVQERYPRLRPPCFILTLTSRRKSCGQFKVAPNFSAHSALSAPSSRTRSDISPTRTAPGDLQPRYQQHLRSNNRARQPNATTTHPPFFPHGLPLPAVGHTAIANMIEPSLRLRRAIHANDALLVQRILKSHPHLLHNPDVSAAGLSNSNLHLAASLGHLQICKTLVSLGHEDPEAALNENHQTALMLAAGAGHTEIVHFLCERYPDNINRRDVRGRDAIMEASLGGHDTVLQILLTYVPGGAAAAVQRADLDGNTALHFASSNGNLLVLRTLLAAGADANRRNVWSWTAVAYSATVQAEVYLKSLVAEAERRREMRRAAGEQKKGAGVRIVTQQVEDA